MQSISKLIIATLAITQLTACSGGGGETSTPASSTTGSTSSPSASPATPSTPSTPTDTSSTSTTAALPKLIDNYTDGLALYEDPNIYKGDYTIDTTYVPNTCGTVYGIAMPNTVSIKDIGNGIITISDLGGSTTITYSAVQPLADFVSYFAGGLFTSCGVGISTINSKNGKTMDQLALACLSNATYASCGTLYDRVAANDFTKSNLIKGVNGGLATSDTALIDAVRGFLDEQQAQK